MLLTADLGSDGYVHVRRRPRPHAGRPVLGRQPGRRDRARRAGRRRGVDRRRHGRAGRRRSVSSMLGPAVAGGAPRDGPSAAVLGAGLPGARGRHRGVPRQQHRCRTRRGGRLAGTSRPVEWSYGLVQGGGALRRVPARRHVGSAPIAVVRPVGPLVDLGSRLMRLDVHQPAVESEAGRRTSPSAPSARGPATASPRRARAAGEHVDCAPVADATGPPRPRLAATWRTSRTPSPSTRSTRAGRRTAGQQDALGRRGEPASPRSAARPRRES